MAATVTDVQEVPCCPTLEECPPCDVMEMRRRLVFPTSLRGPNEQPLTVEVTLHTRFTRCSGPLALGDPIYTTTLLPGEKVRLATTDRRSRFSFDSESNLSYRSEQMSEEQYRMSSFRAAMSDQSSTDNGSSRSTDQGSWDFHGDASGGIGFLSASADANAHGSHNASSTADYLREHSAHASMADHMSVEATRKAHALSIGEVSTRSHQEGESEDHFEASSREFTNQNQCHALSFYFYRINKCETVKFELISIDRRVIDPVAPTPVLANPVRSVGGIASLPQEVPATNTARLEVEARGLQSVAQYAQAGRARFAVAFEGVAFQIGGSPLPPDVRDAAIAEVDSALVDAGLLDKKSGLPSEAIKTEIEFERTASLPTAGVIVKGCLDDCEVCEPELHRKIHLDLDRLELENKLLKRQIELLDQSQEYRCCPAPEEESTEDEDA